VVVLVTYDVATSTPEGRRRLRNIASACLDFGQRVQNSVFECNVDWTQWTTLRIRLLKIIDDDEDSLRFYFLGNNWKRRVEHHGAKATMDLEGPLIT